MRSLYAWLLDVMLCDRTPKHRHDYQHVGYGGCGWHLYRCACGAEEIA